MASIEQSFLTIKREWGSPTIKITVRSEGGALTGIAIDVPLEAFLDAVVNEIGNPTMMVTKAQLRERLRIASDACIEQAKLETRKVM